MEKERYDIWIDISNTPQVFFFSSLVKVLQDRYSFFITSRERGETKDLLEILDVENLNFGKDFRNPFLKTGSLGFRSFQLSYKVPDFDYCFSFENPMPVPTTRLRDKDFVLFLDNDFKVISEKSFVQKSETKVQKNAEYLVVPEVSKERFSKIFKESKIFDYPGYKEHVYISDYEPNTCEEVPFEDYMVLRPESLSSMYVLHEESLVPEILRLTDKKKLNVVYLPREDEDKKMASKFDNVFIPDETLNGLDLCYNANAVLTGSGTMSREAAVLGTSAVSFFPSEKLLSVDQDLVDRCKVLHSRDAEEIVDYVVSNWNDRNEPEFERAKRVIAKIRSIIEEDIISE